MIKKLHNLFWLLTILLTGILTGFVLSHSLILGPWFTWFVSNPEKTPLLYETYSVFRQNHPPTLYNSIFMLQIFSFLVFLIFASIRKYRAPLALIAFLISLVVGIIHFGSGFGELEHAVLSGVAKDAASLARYAKWNVPIHRFHSAGCLASFILLCFYYKKEESTK
ncbi:MAG: hypothetical protein PQJ46_06845 [Spirochaetales bacterium]|nr:hypothetical protein [Spirochaetales bacterium]